MHWDRGSIQLPDVDELVLFGQFHFKVAPDPRLGEKTPDIPGRKFDATPIVCNHGNGFGDTLIEGQILIATQTEPETDEFIGHGNASAS
jgi:hypothetical protein